MKLMSLTAYSLSFNRLLGDNHSDSIITVDSITIPALMIQAKSSITNELLDSSPDLNRTKSQTS